MSEAEGVVLRVVRLALEGRCGEKVDLGPDASAVELLEYACGVVAFLLREVGRVAGEDPLVLLDRLEVNEMLERL